MLSFTDLTFHTCVLTWCTDFLGILCQSTPASGPATIFVTGPNLYLSNLGFKKQPPSPTSSLLSSQNPLRPIHSFGLVSRLRGGNSSDSSSSDSGSDSDPDSDAPKRKRKVKAQLKPRKRPFTAQRKGKAKATEPDSDSGGIRVTAKPEKRKGGMFVDKVFYVDAASAPESLDVPPADHRVAYIFDYTQTPELLRDGDTLMTVDAFIKKEVSAILCQDAWGGPTGTSNNKLAKVVILDPDDIVLCRRSNLTCNSCYKCSLAAEDFLANCQRWSSTDEQHLQVFADTRTAKASESSSVAATAFFRSVKAALCKGTYLDSDGPQKGKTWNILSIFEPTLKVKLDQSCLHRDFCMGTCLAEAPASWNGFSIFEPTLKVELGTCLIEASASCNILSIFEPTLKVELGVFFLLVPNWD
ncbi:hypothetical protein K438DRAFT_1779403 [Mycena galopus ATCC 62051]|nr:hypothetical protein K438DRAFT_1779403 [Mycena galopus ATCC 62051]